MGFMDKAKKMAEQAQQKLDEVQKGFNEGQQGSPRPEGPVTQYDAHGRPVTVSAPGQTGAQLSANRPGDEKCRLS